jgi:hypothetical protein
MIIILGENQQVQSGEKRGDGEKRQIVASSRSLNEGFNIDVSGSSDNNSF